MKNTTSAQPLSNAERYIAQWAQFHFLDSAKHSYQPRYEVHEVPLFSEVWHPWNFSQTLPCDGLSSVIHLGKMSL